MDRRLLPVAEPLRPSPSRISGRVWFAVVCLSVLAAVVYSRLALTFWSSLDTLPPLPAYGVEISSSDELGEPRLDSADIAVDSMLFITLRPAEPVVGPVTLRVFLQSENGPERPWAVHLEQAPSGAFLLRAPVTALPGLRSGRYRLSFVVGRPSAIPPDPAAARRREASLDWWLLDGKISINMQTS